MAGTGQGTEDLEEVLSERLQQLPQPLSRYGSGGTPQAEQSEELFGFEPEQELPPRVRNVQANLPDLGRHIFVKSKNKRASCRCSSMLSPKVLGNAAVCSLKVPMDQILRVACSSLRRQARCRLHWSACLGRRVCQTTGSWTLQR